VHMPKPRPWRRPKRRQRHDDWEDKLRNEEKGMGSGAEHAAKMAASPARRDFPAWLDGRHHTAHVRRHDSVQGHDGKRTRLDVRPVTPVFPKKTKCITICMP
jgi:hypothetical protein